MSNQNVIKGFADVDQAALPLAGGKGANLGELVQAEMPVPPGFIITTKAYEAFVAANELQGQIIDLVRHTRPDDPAAIESTSQKIRALFVQGIIPEDLITAMTDAYHTLTQEHGRAVAVRSSATAEDLPAASFAGQQDSYLNIQGEAALLKAIKQCWGSLWTARAIAYRMRQGIDPAEVSLAVVIQQLVPAEAAGVLFTANPTDGERDEIVINATWGLGEALVGGEVTPDTVVVSKSSWQILSRETAAKTMMTVRTEAGTEQQAVPHPQQTEPVVDDDAAVTLAHYGTQIESHFERPMDIEWAIADGAITILQARPITHLPPPPLKNVVWEPVAPNTIWMRRQIVEHMPEPLSPLFEDLYLYQGMDQTVTQLLEAMGEIGGTDLDFAAMMPHRFAATINGYAYTTASFNMNWQNLVAILKIYTRIRRFLTMSAFDWDGVVLPQYQVIIAKWEAVDLAEAADKALLQGLREMAAADSRYWFGSSVNLALSRTLDPLFDRLLHSPLIRYALPEPPPSSASFLRGFDSKVLDAQANMEALAQMIGESAALRELVHHTAANRLLKALATHPEGQPVLDGIHDYLDEYGHQIYNLDFAAPTQNEEPLPLLVSLKGLVENPPEQDVRTRQARMAEEREALVAETLARLNPVSRPLFRWAWKWTKQYAPYRENVMFYMGLAWPTVRRLAHELGQRLTAAGTLNQPDDIYYLDSSEITAAIEARANGQRLPAFVELTEERRELREARKRLTPPPRVPQGGRLKVGPLDLSMFDPTPSDAVSDGPVLNGFAVSTGRVTAEASVIHSSTEFDQMKPGTILVCTTTTPAWTPLFSQATGLVTDVGGALAHGSIVAREYGIPAVMGTGNATERIKSGQRIQVDGDQGMVTLVDQMEGQEAEQSQGKQDAENQATARRRKLWIGGIVGILVGLLWWWRKRRS